MAPYIGRYFQNGYQRNFESFNGKRRIEYLLVQSLIPFGKGTIYEISVLSWKCSKAKPMRHKKKSARLPPDVSVQI